MRPGRKRPARRPLGSSASTWAARAAWRTGSTRCTCPMCGREPGTRWRAHGSGYLASTSPTRLSRWSWGCRWIWSSVPKGSWPWTSALTATPTAWRSIFICGDEVYGSCTRLREFLEEQGQAYVLRVASDFTVAMPGGTKLTCAELVKRLLKGKRRWEVRSAGKGSKGERWYAWAWIGARSPGHSLLVRRHLRTGELAFHYCYVPEGQACAKARLVRAAGLR